MSNRTLSHARRFLALVPASVVLGFAFSLLVMAVRA